MVIGGGLNGIGVDQSSRLRYLALVHGIVLVVIVVDLRLLCCDIVSGDLLACILFGPVMVRILGYLCRLHGDPFIRILVAIRPLLLSYTT